MAYLSSCIPILAYDLFFSLACYAIKLNNMCITYMEQITFFVVCIFVLLPVVFPYGSVDTTGVKLGVK